MQKTQNVTPLTLIRWCSSPRIHGTMHAASDDHSSTSGSLGHLVMVKYVVPETVLIQEVASETVLMDMEKGAYYELNHMGSEMLKRLRETGDLQRVTESLIGEYDVSRTVLDQDIKNLISDLERNGLIQRAL